MTRLSQDMWTEVSKEQPTHVSATTDEVSPMKTSATNHGSTGITETTSTTNMKPETRISTERRSSKSIQLLQLFILLSCLIVNDLFDILYTFLIMPNFTFSLSFHCHQYIRIYVNVM